MINEQLRVTCPKCTAMDAYEFFKPTEGNIPFQISCHHCGSKLTGSESLGAFIPRVTKREGITSELTAVSINEDGETQTKIQSLFNAYPLGQNNNWLNLKEFNF